MSLSSLQEDEKRWRREEEERRRRRAVSSVSLSSLQRRVRYRREEELRRREEERSSSSEREGRRREEESHSTDSGFGSFVSSTACQPLLCTNVRRRAAVQGKTSLSSLTWLNKNKKWILFILVAAATSCFT